jgi:hypothetical protein
VATYTSSAISTIARVADPLRLTLTKPFPFLR